MTMILQTNPPRESPALPDDLSLYIGKKTLVLWILDILDDLNLRRLDEANEITFSQPAVMLTLLTYCYATGLYGSEEVQLAIQHDPMIRYLCARSYPDPCGIRTFRRYNRERIAEGLAAVLRRVWEMRFWAEDAVPIGHGRGSSLAGRMGVKVTPNFRLEAERRIARAVRMDCMALDE